MVSLFLSDNNVERIHQKAFRGLTKLKTLVLTRNNLSILNEGIFTETQNMKKLSINFNYFSKFPVEGWIQNNNFGTLF